MDYTLYNAFTLTNFANVPRKKLITSISITPLHSAGLQ